MSNIPLTGDLADRGDVCTEAGSTIAHGNEDAGHPSPLAPKSDENRPTERAGSKIGHFDAAPRTLSYLPEIAAEASEVGIGSNRKCAQLWPTVAARRYFRHHEPP